MMHPDTELRFIDPIVGHGVVATRFIPKGTITWVLDPLDRRMTPAAYEALPAMIRRALEMWVFQVAANDFILCWDHGRFVNHSCDPNCCAPGQEFELAIRDISPGEQLTDDYGRLRCQADFECRCGAGLCRARVRHDEDFELLGRVWDALTATALAQLPAVMQPLWELLSESDKSHIADALAGRRVLSSCRPHAR